MISTPAVRPWIAAAALAALTGGLAMAASPPVPARAPVIQSVLDCRKVEDTAQRLACYDKAVDTVAKADASGDLVTVDRDQRRTLRRQAYGFNLPSLNMFDRGEKVEENERLTAKVASASQDKNGRWVVRLDDGAVWAHTDDSTLYPGPRPGSTAVVRKGSLGSFFMNIDGKEDFKAARRS